MIAAIILITTIAALFLIRNQMVFSFRMKIIDGMPHSEEWRKYHNAYCTVEYMEMLFKFWKPLRLESVFHGEELRILQQAKTLIR